jgi:hypothetical protein
MTKTKTVTIPVKRSFGFSGAIMEMDHDRYIAHVTGELIIAIGRGEFSDKLRLYLSLPHERGRSEYHDSLIKEAK